MEEKEEEEFNDIINFVENLNYDEYINDVDVGRILLKGEFDGAVAKGESGETKKIRIN